jgi:hypothetical protein
MDNANDFAGVNLAIIFIQKMANHADLIIIVYLVSGLGSHCSIILLSVARSASIQNPAVVSGNISARRMAIGRDIGRPPDSIIEIIASVTPNSRAIFVCCPNFNIKTPFVKVNQ